MAAQVYIINPCVLLDVRLYLGLNFEVGSRLDDKYNMTRGAAKGDLV